MLYGRRIGRLDNDRLVKTIAMEMKARGNLSWWEEYGILLRKYGQERVKQG